MCLYNNSSEKEQKPITYEEFVNQNTNTENLIEKLNKTLNKCSRNDDILKVSWQRTQMDTQSEKIYR